MEIDNPFFTLAARRLRRGKGYLAAPAHAAGWTALACLIATLVSEPAVFVIGIVAHTAICLFGGISAAAFVMGAGEPAGVSESLLMLPWSPGRWLARRLAFPALRLLIIWAAGFPAYVAATIYESGATELAQLALIPALGAAVGLVLGFQLSWLRPETLVTPLRRSLLGLGVRLAWTSELVCLLWLPIGLALLLLLYPLNVPSPEEWLRRYLRYRPFYGGSVREGFLTFPCLMAAAAAAFANARRSLDSGLPAYWSAWRWRLFAALLLYYVVLGLYWNGSIAVRWSLSLLPLAVWVLVSAFELARRPSRRPEADAAALLLRFTDNPLLIRDFRSHCHQAGLLRGMIRSLAASAVLIAVLGLPGGALKFGPERIFIMAGFILFEYAGGLVALRARMKWIAEGRSGSLVLLLASPIPSRALVCSRFQAAALYQLLCMLPTLGTYLAGAIWCAGHDPARVGAAMLSHLGMLAGIASGVNGFDSIHRAPWGARAVRLTLYLGVTIGSSLLMGAILLLPQVPYAWVIPAGVVLIALGCGAGYFDTLQSVAAVDVFRSEVAAVPGKTDRSHPAKKKPNRSTKA